MAEPVGDNIEECSDDGECGYLCHCSDDGDVAWYEYSDVTTTSSTRSEKKYDQFLRLLKSLFKSNRSRRSPRFEVMKHLRDDDEGSVDACHYSGDEFYSDEECDPLGDYEVNNDDQECDD